MYALSVNLLIMNILNFYLADVFIEEFPAGEESPSFSFDIKVSDDAPIGTFKMCMNITATVYQDGFGEFSYDVTVEYICTCR